MPGLSQFPTSRNTGPCFLTINLWPKVKRLMTLYLNSMNLITKTITLVTIFASISFAQIAITEINSSSDATDDWFELTNTGSSAVDITGWGFDDFPENLDNIALLEDITSIAAGESVVFFEFDDESGVALADQATDFRTAWGGLAGVQLGFHRGSGLGRDDGVSIFDASQALVAQEIYFDPAAAPEADLHAGESVGATDIDSAIFDLSSGTFIAPTLGSLGVFAASDGGLGSPGVSVPEPSSISMILFGCFAFALRRRRR